MKKASFRRVVPCPSEAPRRLCRLESVLHTLSWGPGTVLLWELTIVSNPTGEWRTPALPHTFQTQHTANETAVLPHQIIQTIVRTPHFTLHTKHSQRHTPIRGSETGCSDGLCHGGSPLCVPCTRRVLRAHSLLLLCRGWCRGPCNIPF